MVASHSVIAKRYKGADPRTVSFSPCRRRGATAAGVDHDMLTYSRRGEGNRWKSLGRVWVRTNCKGALGEFTNTDRAERCGCDHDPLPAIEPRNPTQLKQVFQNPRSGKRSSPPSAALLLTVSATKTGQRLDLFPFARQWLGIASRLERLVILFQRLPGENEFEGTRNGLGDFCKNVLTASAAGTGSSPNPKKALPSTLPCRNAFAIIEDDWVGCRAYQVLLVADSPRRCPAKTGSVLRRTVHINRTWSRMSRSQDFLNREGKALRTLPPGLILAVDLNLPKKKERRRSWRKIKQSPVMKSNSGRNLTKSA